MPSFIHLIPTTPDYLPPTDRAESAAAVFAEAWPSAPPQTINTHKLGLTGDAENVVIQLVVWDKIAFLCGAENLEAVRCPFCSARLDSDKPPNWWIAAMDRAAKGDFRDLAVDTPCCRRGTSLNDLVYDGSAGFARFSLSVWDPGIGDPSPDLLRRIGEAMGCEVRRIWEHL